eukprot:scaffold37223_cov326-Isochrysis_galbana.AAC.2
MPKPRRRPTNELIRRIQLPSPSLPDAGCPCQLGILMRDFLPAPSACATSARLTSRCGTGYKPSAMGLYSPASMSSCGVVLKKWAKLQPPFC